MSAGLLLSCCVPLADAGGGRKGTKRTGSTIAQLVLQGDTSGAETGLQREHRVVENTLRSTGKAGLGGCRRAALVSGVS